MSFWPATIVGLVVLLAAAEGSRNKVHSFAIGWAFGFGQAVVSFNWLAQSFEYQSGLPQWTGLLAVPLLSAYLAVFPALALMAARWVGPGHATFRVLAFPGAWVILEWARGWLFTGFPWNPLGAIWIDVPVVAQSAQWVGALGLSGLTALLAGSLFHFWRSHPATFSMQIAALLLVHHMGRENATEEGSSELRVRVVQPNTGQDEKWRADLAQQQREKLLALSGNPRGDGKTRLIFWPEAAIADDVERTQQTKLQMAKILGPKDLLLTGAVTLTAGSSRQAPYATNSMFVIDSNATVLARYDKAHLVPFGEYVPAFAKWLGLSRFAAGSVDFKQGAGPGTLTLPGLPKIGVDICYEIIFPGNVTDPVDRPAFIFNPSNDAWFGRWGPPQHLVQARLRAIEEGLPVIRSTPTGISAIIRKDGSVAAQIPLNTPGYIEGDLPPAGEPTVFSRHGHLVAMSFALLAMAAALIIGLRHRGRSKGLPLRWRTRFTIS